MLLSQIVTSGGLAVVAREGSEAAIVKGAASVYALALEAAESGRRLADVVAARGLARRWTCPRWPRRAS